MKEVTARKQRIIDATIEVLNEKPIAKATMREIAAKAGLTTGAIYHHYKDKDELFLDVIKQSLQFTHKLAPEVGHEKKLSTSDQVLSEIISQVEKRISKTDRQKLHILLLSDAISRNGQVKEKYRTNYQIILSNVSRLFEDAFQVTNPKYQKSVASILVAAMDGIAMQQALEVLPEDLDKTIDVFINFFVQSIPLFLANNQE